jgi:PAS domain S-box-containing protein
MNSRRIKILLIEDNPGDAGLIRKMLSEAARISFDLEQADRLSAGLERLNVKDVDVVLLDLSLPDAQGLGTFLKLHAHSPAVPTLVLDGLADEELAVKVVREGAQDCLVKGQMTSDLLVRVIRYAIERARAGQALQKAHDELERRVEERTAELRALNESLQREIETRKRAEEALRESESRFQLLFEEAPVGYQSLDEDGNIVALNKTCVDLLGYSKEEAIGRWFGEFIAPDDQEPLRECFDDLKASGQVHGVAYEVVRKDGSQIIVSFDGTIGYDESGHFRQTHCTLYDITEQVQAEKALRESEELFRGLAENVEDAFWLGTLGTEDRGRILYVSPAFERTFGIKSEEVYESDSRWVDVLHEDDRERTLRALQAFVQGEGECDVEYRIVRSDGSTRWIWARGFYVRDEQGLIERTAGLAQDITERKRAEEALRQRTEVLETILENIPVMIAFLDRHGHHQWVNRCWQQTMGWSLAEAQSHDVLAEFYPDPQYRQYVVDYIAAAHSTWGDFRTRARDGRVLDTLWANVPLRDGSNIGIGLDITERKRAEEALQRYNRELELLNRASQAFSSTLDLSRVLSAILDEVRHLLGVVACSVWLVDPDTDELVCYHSTGPQNELVQGWRLAPGEGIAGATVRSGESLIITDTQADERYFENVGAQTGLALRSILSIPLRVQENTIGVLQAVDTEVDRFSPEDLDLLEPLAAAAASHIENARLYQAERKRATQLAVVNRVARQAVSILDVGLLLREIVADIQRGFSYHNVALLLLDHDTGELGRQAMVGAFEDLARPHYHQPVEEGLIGWAAQTGQSLLVNDVAQDPRYVVGFSEEVPTQSEMCVPLKLAGRVIGVLDVHEIRLNAFDRADLMAMETLADQIAVAIENARLYQQMQREIEERKRVEEALRESEDNLRRAEQIAHVGYWSRDVASGEITQSDETYRIFGLEPQAMKLDLTTLPDHIHLEDRQVVNRAIQDAVAGTRPYDLEYRALRPDGTVRWVHSKGEVRLDEDGQPERMFGVVLDITDRKRADEALRESEERFRQMAENSRDVFWMRDLESLELLYVTPAYERLWGQSIENTYGQSRSWLMNVHSEDRDRLAAAFERQVRGEYTDNEYRVVWPDGSVHWMRDRVTPVLNEAGVAYRIFGVIEDISERKQAEEALRDSEERYRSLFEGAEDHIFVLDQDFRYVMVNPSALKAGGFTLEDVVGKGPRELFPEDAEFYLSQYRQAFETGESVRFERKLRFPDGTHWFSVTLSPIKNAQGRVIALTGISRDITERKQVEEALRRHMVQLEVVRETGLEITAQLDLDILLNTIVSRAIGLLGGGVGGIYLYRPEQEVLEWAVAVGPELAPLGTVLHRGEGLSGKAWEAGKSLAVDDYQHWEGRAAIYDGYPFTAVAAVPIRWGDEFLGVLNVLDEPPRTFSPSDLDALTMFTTQAAIAIKNARLFEEVESGHKQLRNLAGYLQNAREEERTHIAREIHDEFGQALTALRIDLSWCAKRLSPERTDLVEKVNDMSDLVDATIQMVRRVATELRPGLLDDLGLVAALEWQAQDFCERAGIAYDLALGDEEAVLDLDRDLATAMFRVFQETLTNVARHAGATEIRVTLEERDDELLLIVRDNGRGISKRQVSGPRSLGLMGMRERIRLWGGDVMFKGVPGKGTTVTVRVPHHKLI